MLHGLLLAAGAGSRMGQPKALVRDASGQPWLARSVGVLLDGGCDRVTVVLGASADEAERLLAEHVTGAAADLVDLVRASAWQAGMGVSLQTGLAALGAGGASAVLVHLVDLPDVGAEVVARVLTEGGSAPTALARASYDGKPGHPVVLGRDHWAGVVDAASGDRGARLYLDVNDPVLVECGDLASGADVDRPTPGQRDPH